MSVTYPLAHADFADRLRPLSFQFKLLNFREVWGLEEGSAGTNDFAAPKWQADFESIPLTLEDAANIYATIEALDSAGANGTFYLYRLARPGNNADPHGVHIAGGQQSISQIGSDNKSIRLEGMPANYVISPGSFLSWNYGTNPVRRAFHRVTEQAVANGSGTTQMFEVRPYLKAGTAVGQIVSVYKASAKMFLTAFDPGRPAGLMVEGLSFSAMEVRG